MRDEVNVLPSLKEHENKFSFPCLNDLGEMIFKKSTFADLEEENIQQSEMLEMQQRELEEKDKVIDDEFELTFTVVAQ